MDPILCELFPVARGGYCRRRDHTTQAPRAYFLVHLFRWKLPKPLKVTKTFSSCLSDIHVHPEAPEIGARIIWPLSHQMMVQRHKMEAERARCMHTDWLENRKQKPRAKARKREWEENRLSVSLVRSTLRYSTKSRKASMTRISLSLSLSAKTIGQHFSLCLSFGFFCLVYCQLYRTLLKVDAAWEITTFVTWNWQ